MHIIKKKTIFDILLVLKKHTMHLGVSSYHKYVDVTELI